MARAESESWKGVGIEESLGKLSLIGPFLDCLWDEMNQGLWLVLPESCTRLSRVWQWSPPHITQDIQTESGRFLKKTRVLPEGKVVLKQLVFPTEPDFIKHQK